MSKLFVYLKVLKILLGNILNHHFKTAHNIIGILLLQQYYFSYLIKYLNLFNSGFELKFLFVLLFQHKYIKIVVLNLLLNLLKWNIKLLYMIHMKRFQNTGNKRQGGILENVIEVTQCKN